MDRRLFLKRSATTAAGFGVLRNLAACSSSGASSAGSAVTPATASPFVTLRERYFVQFLLNNPVVSTYLGGDGYSAALARVNATLRDYSTDALATERSFYAATKLALSAIPIDALPGPQKIDWTVMDAQLSFLVHQLDRRYHERAVDTYVAEPFRGVDWQLQQMTDAGGGLLGTAEEWQLVVQRVRAIPKYVDIAKVNLLAGKEHGDIPDRRMIQRDGIDGSAANAQYFSKTLLEQAVKYLGSRGFAAQTYDHLQTVARRAAQAWDSFGSFLGQAYDLNEIKSRFAVGTEEYEWRVKTVLRDNRSAADLYAYGADQVALYTDKVFQVAKQIASDQKLNASFGSQASSYAGVRAVMDKLSQDSPRNDDELLQWYVDAGKRAVQYGRDQRLFDVPSDYRLDVWPTPPVLQSTIDAAYYPAPPFKKSGVGRFYLTPTNNDAGALKENNRASVADTAVHEGFPGHDWHYKYMTEHASAISNIRWLTPGAVEDSSSMWSDSMATEGWALYSEELMSTPTPSSPYGFYSAGEYMYELQGQLLRAVRVRVDTGIHTGRMTFEEARDYFTEHVNFLPGACARSDSDAQAHAVCSGATRAIYRYSKWPTQAITYNLGKNTIVNLREAWKQKLGSAYDAKAFHEKFMSMGTIPVPYFRDQFLNA